MENNFSNESCADRYDKPAFYGLMYFRCGLSVISVLCILSMLVIIVLFKKYRFFTQRLIMYLAISTLTYQVISAMDVTSISAYTNETAKKYCIFIGFATQIVIWWPVMATTVIVVDIFVRVTLKKDTDRLEILYILLIFVLSFLFNWIPFVDNGFGPAQYLCWIKDENLEDDCTPYNTGIILRAVLFILPYYILAGLMILFLILTAIFLRRWRKNYAGKFDPQALAMKKKMEREVYPVLYYPLIFIISAIASLILTIYNAVVGAADGEVGYIVISVILSLVFRLQGVFITLVFTFDPETRKKLNVMEIKAAVMEFTKTGQGSEYPAKYNTRGDSFAASNSAKVIIN